MRKLYFYLMGVWFSLIVLQNVNAQNLVPNPGFEVQDTCPAVSQITLAHPWVSPTLGTPDLFNSTCSTQNVPGKTGIGSSGVFCFNTFPNNREYIQAPLNAPLIAGQTYCVTFYVYRSNYRYSINRIGAYFSNGAINQSNTSNIAVTPQVQNPTGNMLSGSGWLPISGSFVAAGGETHIIIGNFATDANTDTLVTNSSSTSYVSYYRIDDISVISCVVGLDDITSISNQIETFPSPASEVIYVKNPNNFKLLAYDIFNLSGKVVKSGSWSEQGNDAFPIDLFSIDNGLYILSLETEAGRINKKFAVAR